VWWTTCRPLDAVVDFGCGEGDFSDARRRVRRTVGVDHNPARSNACETWESKDTPRASRVRGEEEGAFDVACGFQILEHLPRSSDLLEPAVRCVRPGGRIFISVPNRRRYRRADTEPFDCPPHHTARWGPEQFVTLADHYGLELGEIHYEQPDLSMVVEKTFQRPDPPARSMDWAPRGETDRPSEPANTSPLRPGADALTGFSTQRFVFRRTTR